MTLNTERVVYEREVVEANAEMLADALALLEVGQQAT